ncbi:MAG: hypothetical protein JY451_12190 [Erythrobacter sp.]|nr:MAG: hypothetical protein JY451_12190 [Erythrobacter sp.]
MKNSSLAVLAIISGLCLSAPARASINDQFACETSGSAGELFVTIMAMQPGVAIVQDSRDVSGEVTQIVLEGSQIEGHFAFLGHGASFVGSGNSGRLFYEADIYVCVFPLDEELGLESGLTD